VAHVAPPELALDRLLRDDAQVPVLVRPLARAPVREGQRERLRLRRRRHDDARHGLARGVADGAGDPAVAFEHGRRTFAREHLVELDRRFPCQLPDAPLGGLARRGGGGGTLPRRCAASGGAVRPRILVARRELRPLRRRPLPRRPALRPHERTGEQPAGERGRTEYEDAHAFPARL